MVVQQGAHEHDAQQPVVAADTWEADADAGDVAAVVYDGLLGPVQHLGPVDLDGSNRLNMCGRLDVEPIEAGAVVAAHPVGQLGRRSDDGFLGPHLPDDGIGQRRRDLHGDGIEDSR